MKETSSGGGCEDSAEAVDLGRQCGKLLRLGDSCSVPKGL